MNRRTQAALDMWKEMGDKASTPSTVATVKKSAKLSEDDRPGTVHKQSALAATGAA